jgi:hypothetical protein
MARLVVEGGGGVIVLVKIGHMRLILPNERGVQTLLTVLSKGQVVEDDQRYMGGPIKMSQSRLEVNIEPLPGYAYTKRREVLDPEVIRPDRKQIAGPRPIAGGRTARELVAGLRLLQAGGGL